MKYLKISTFALIFLGYILTLPPSQSAQTILTGTWKSEEYSQNLKYNDEAIWNDTDDKREKLHLTFVRRSKDGNSSNGMGYAYEELQGLTKEQVNSSNVSVKFQIVREAGVIECEGKFNNGKGAGTWTFTPNKNFVEAMQSKGFKFDDEKLFAAATLDLTVAFVEDIRSAGFKNLETDDLFKAKIFKIDSSFMKEMAATGFSNLEMEDLVKARIFKINPNFVKEVVEMGFAKDSLEDLVKLRIFKITPDYLREMKAIGFVNLDAEEATKLRIFKVTPEFIKQMKDEGLNNLSVEEATKLRIFNIDSNFIRKAKSQSKNDLDVEELVKMKIFGAVK